MIKFENTVTPSPEQWEFVIRSMRNPLNSWDKSDSGFTTNELNRIYRIGNNDFDLMKRLAKAGTDHRKIMRMLNVYVDITAPLYLLKELDTYKVGTVCNSCSTMHKIQAKEFTLDDFSHDHLKGTSIEALQAIIDYLNINRAAFNSTTTEPYIEGLSLSEEGCKKLKKEYWWNMIQMLPSSYNQKRSYMFNYETLANIYHGRKNHKLDEWHHFCDWIETLPCSEIITGKEN